MIVKELIEWLEGMEPSAVVKLNVGIEYDTGASEAIADLDAMTSNGPVVTLIGSEV